MAAGEGKCIDFLRSLIGHKGDDCVDWPFSKGHDGYGRMGFYGKMYTANRMMCILAHGDPPTPEHYAAHSCGKGHLGCVNPNHLSWKTVRENEADKKVHGTARGSRGNRTILTSEDIAAIRASKGVVPIKVLAKRYGLTFSGIRYWQASAHAPASQHKLIAYNGEKLPLNTLARRHGMSGSKLARRLKLAPMEKALDRSIKLPGELERRRRVAW